MTDTTVTVRTQKELKKQVQEFLKPYGISISSAINMFFSDIVTNQRLSVDIHGSKLVPINLENTSPEIQVAYYESKQLKEEDFISYSIEDYADKKNQNT